MTNRPPANGSDEAAAARTADELEAEELDRRVVRNSAWVAVSLGVGQVVQMGSMVALVRLLTPSQFGVVALGLTLLFVLQHVQESGVNSAFVHLREDPRRMAASGLLYTIGSGTVLSLVVVAAAPLYTWVMHAPSATGVVRGLGALLFLRGLTLVPQAILEREMQFRPRAYSDVAGSVAQTAVAISCAAVGFGAWSLVFGQLAGSTVQLVIVWAFVPWRPRVRDASRETLRTMMRYGRYIAGANLVNLLNTSVDNLSVGRFVGTAGLGVYALAWRLAEIPNVTLSPIVGKVLFSVFSRVQHDLAVVRRVYLDGMQRSIVLALPATVGLALAADPIVPAVLGDRWHATITPLRILAAFGFLRMLFSPSGELFRGIGRARLMLGVAILYLATAVTLLAILVPLYGTTGAATAMLLTAALNGSVVTGFTLRVLHLPLVDLLAAFARPIACSVPLAAVILALHPLIDGLPPLAELGVLAVVGLAVYAGSVALLGRSIVVPIWTALRRKSEPVGEPAG